MKDVHILERIQELCNERHWTLYQLSKASGISYSTLNTMMNKKNLPSLTTLERLCGGFGISMADFFEPERKCRALTGEQTALLSFFSVLSPTEKQMAMAYLKGLAGK